MADASPSSAPSGPSVKQTAIAMLVVSLVGAGLGALLAVSPAPRENGAPASAAVSAGLFDLPPIVTNLAAPQDTWIRLEASMVFDPKATPHPEAVSAEIANDVIAYLRTINLVQLQGTSGLQSFRQSLNERAAIRSSGKVNELVLRTLVIQ